MESEQCQGVGLSQGCAVWLCVPLPNNTLWYTQPRNSKSLLLPNEVLTLMTGGQVKYSVAKYQGTLRGQMEGDGLLSGHRTGT